MSDNRILFSDKNYRLLMTGQTVSTLGNSVSSFAFFAYTLALTQSPFYAALVSGCVTLATVVMGIPAGIWADKHRPLPLMLSSTILGGAGICVVVANHFILHAPIPLVLAVAACVENPGQPRTFGAGDGDQPNKIFPGDGGGTHLWGVPALPPADRHIRV